MSCSQKISQKTIQDVVKSTQLERQYKIKTYIWIPEVLYRIDEIAEAENMTTLQLIKFVVENPDRSIFTQNIYSYLSLNTYYAKQIINYSDTDIRFIDNAGKEQFISADYIEVIAP
ncbi:MAG: hypothetical protein ACYCXQ_02330 [Candidatus Humimicrobiaceae bacterium]